MLTSKELRRVARMMQAYPGDPNPCFGAAPDPVKAARYRADQANRIAALRAYTAKKKSRSATRKPVRLRKPRAPVRDGKPAR